MGKNIVSLALITMVITSLSVIAQSAPEGLVGCLSSNGTLYNVSPKDLITEKCQISDFQVELGTGSINSITVGNGLVGGGISGDITIKIDPEFALPPACPPGQVALSDDKGGWVCTPPSRLGTANSVAKLWVVPFYRRFEGSFGTGVRVVNTSTESGKVSCLYFEHGALLLDSITTKNVGPGGQTFCRTSEDLEPTWFLIASDVNVVATAFYRNYQSGYAARNVVAYPVDCQYPEGYEFVCGFIRND